ncbi:MAG: metallo-beta-lactamase family protein [Parcubacteria group bacterium Gr01-1014_29]|nr:MAG: metallo-beta-lactamase family protein [Parcubacteria group bacterium Gr01-1014_29]
MSTITFFGGAREVTGACYRIETPGKNILVDCGLMQARENERDANHAPFGFDPREIDALFVTHAHIDHIGRIPKLAREGFSGTIYSTAATRDLARPLLEDALAVAEHEREEPLYDERDIEKTFTLWQEIDYRAPREEYGVRFQLRDAGHILGSSMVELWVEGKHLLFTGDLGNVPSELVPPPDSVDAADYLIIESTYGSRTHEAPAEREIQLERAVEDIAFRKGTLLIPAFATERTQDILHLLNEMLHFKRIPEMPVFVDSPLAIRITEVFEKYPALYNQEIQKLLFEHPDLFQFRRLKFTKSVEESKHINDIPGPKVVIAGSGMMTGGRILHHAKRYTRRGG